MINVINESFKNFPSWLKSFLSGAKYISQDLANKFNVDLYNASIDNVSDPKDSRLKDTDSIVFVNLQSKGTGPRSVYVYKPVGDGKYRTINDVYITSQDKNASKLTNKKLLDLADNMAVLSISSNKKPKKDKYQDPRYDRKGKYAGQYKGYGGNYYTVTGRDKSGYVIPDPAKLVGKLYDFNIDNTADVLDNYYNKINRIKSRLLNIDFRQLDDKQQDNYNYAISELKRVTDSFIRLERDINRLLSRIGGDRWNNELQERDMTEDELFSEWLQWNSTYKISLDDAIRDIQRYMRNL